MSTIHLVSHTHWDREWYRTFQQFRLKLVHLIDGVLELLDSDHNFKHFMLDGQTIVLDDYLHMRPENADRLRRYIRNGRLVIGPWHILPDEFLVSPEATIRNLLEGRRTCDKFGPRMMVGYIPDPFGHIGQMPQILNGFDIQTACVQRGLSDEPCEFWWEAPDGSRLLMAYLRDGYGNAASLPTSDPDFFISEIRRLRDSLAAHSVAGRHILLMHGTDHTEPPPDTSKVIAATRGRLDGDELVHSTLTDYLTAVQRSLHGKTIPTIRGELRDCKRSHLLPGVLSTRMWIKQRNRACETLLEKWAEPFSTFASRMTTAPPAEAVIQKPASIIRQAWRLLMENHPHDSICGCSIDQVHDEMKIRFDQVEQIGEEITRQGLETLAASIQTNVGSMLEEHHPSSIRNSSSSIVVFNPLSFSRTDVVEATVESNSPFDLLDDLGESIPYQVQGLGSKELINAILTSKELQRLYVNIHDGRIMGMSILAIQMERQGDSIQLKATVSGSRQPDLESWQKGVAEIETWIANPEIKTFHVRAISVDASRITLCAAQVPGLGWKTYFIRPKPDQEKKPVQLPLLGRLFLPLLNHSLLGKLLSHPRKSRHPHRIENEHLIVEARKDGSLDVTDKETGLLTEGLNQFLDGGDCGDEYNYCPPLMDHQIKPYLKRVSFSSNPIQQSLTLSLELATPSALTPDRSKGMKQRSVSQITACITLTSGVPRVDIQTTIANLTKDHRLRVHFPASFAVKTAQIDGHFEIVERDLGLPPIDETWVEHPRPEFPQRAFTSISNGQQRLTITNRGLPEVEILTNEKGNSEIAVTLLRCVGWLSRDDFSNRRGHAGPSIETPGAQMLGKWTFDYSISLEKEVIPSYQQSYAFETPLRSASTGIHAGIHPASGSFIQVSHPEFLITTIKEADNEDGWLARGVNLSGQDLQVSLKPWESFKKMERTNLAEEKTGAIRPNRDGGVSFLITGHRIATLLFRN